MKINVNEIFEMNLSELTFEQFAIAMIFCILCAALGIIFVSALCELLKLIVDLGFYLFGKNKRLGGWWFKRDLCAYICIITVWLVRLRRCQHLDLLTISFF